MLTMSALAALGVVGEDVYPMAGYAESFSDVDAAAYLVASHLQGGQDHLLHDISGASIAGRHRSWLLGSQRAARTALGRGGFLRFDGGKQPTPQKEIEEVMGLHRDSRSYMLWRSR